MSLLHIIHVHLNPEVSSVSLLLSLLPLIWFSFSQQSQMESVPAAKDELFAR